MRPVLLQPLLLADDVLQVQDGLGHGGVDVDQVVGADGALAAQHPLVEGQAQGQVQLRRERGAESGNTESLGEAKGPGQHAEREDVNCKDNMEGGRGVFTSLKSMMALAMSLPRKRNFIFTLAMCAGLVVLPKGTANSPLELNMYLVPSWLPGGGERRDPGSAHTGR